MIKSTSCAAGRSPATKWVTALVVSVMIGLCPQVYADNSVPFDTNEIRQAAAATTLDSASPFHEADARVEPSQSGSPVTPATLAQILRQIDSYYVDDVDVNTLMETAVKGLFKQLDPHSAYLNEQDLNALFEMTNGEYNGLGVEVEMRNELLVILDTIKNSPAEAAGLQKGDIIRKINGVPVHGKNLEQVSLLIKRAKDKTDLVVTRDYYDQPLQFTLEKAQIEVESVSPKLMDNNIGYLKLYTFQSGSTKEMAAAIEQLKQQAPNGLKGFILDLRDNPGGVLDSAVGVSDLFLQKGTIVSTRGRFIDANRHFSATPGDIIEGVPMYVLINKGSASASEIVAGALKENHRATIVGMQSYGKGSVQSLIPLGNGTTAIKLTTALYFTPDGTSINGIGIKPDVEIPQQQVNDDRQSPIMSVDDRWTLSGKMLANRDFQLDEVERMVLKHIRE